ncbi:transcriptional regulator [Pseudooceanicola sediminis]|uniref:Transcriptional regulator n=1 Tax=Pseudooceanicola sediminis TaxID=2211117 RepID=A0A399J6N0_9RHOB|nr:ATP-binding protein [Pseudooceanicola sediminis]KAA2315592.1 transcriptional regulator [Puniceibacterium sp. HSS470]RII40207.1 transcriptional regulator [Pseudooceanicola sediminis]
MSQNRDIEIVDDLRARSSENGWLEFKKNWKDPFKIGIYISALSNSARLEGKDSAYLVWGVENDTHEIVGTSFDPGLEIVGNQPLEMWLRQRLSPAPAFHFREVLHPSGRVVLLEIPAPILAPTAFDSIAYIRSGSATPKLSEDQLRYQALIEKLRPYTWENGVALSYVSTSDVLRLLDVDVYYRLLGESRPDSDDRVLERLEVERLVRNDFGARWDVLNLGAILFASNLSDFGPSMARKGVRFVRYSGADRTTTVTHRQDGKKGYAAGFENLLEYVNGLLPQNEHIGQALRESHPLFPRLSLRELIANALIHQDLTITGAGPQIELFADRIEITNPGCPLVDTDRMIDQPPRSRNETLAALMRRMGMCEEQGSGLDKVFREVEVFQLPAPLLRSTEAAMQVVLYGPRTFAEMTPEERVRACYFHTVLRFMAGERMKNTSLCERFGIDKKNAAQASAVIGKALDAGLIKYADEDHPRAGYHPWWS